ncbi:MAG: DUF748 domain-containing protein [Verrucomicrobiota bacterium]
MKQGKFRHWCRSRPVLYALAGVIVLLVVVRVELSHIIKVYANHQLNKSQDYSGQIGDVTVHLWRGAYQIHDIHILKRNGEVSTPFYSTGVLDLSLEWSELLHGALVSKIAMLRPSVNFISGPTKDQSQTGKENDWGQMLESLAPFKINRLEIQNGQIHFQNPYAEPPVDIYLNDLSVLATNFTNSRRSSQALPAGIRAQGKTLGSGTLDLLVHVNPLAETPAFELTGALTNVDLVSLNNFLKAYGRFDVARGDFALFTSFAAKDGNYDGYCKVFFNHLKVFSWEKDKHKDALEIFWKAIVGTLATAFKNQPHDQLATKIPITGRLGKTDVHYWPTIATLLRNAFIKGLVPKVDEPVTLETVENHH